MGHARPMRKSGWLEYKKKNQLNTPEFTGPVAPARPPPPALNDPAAFPPVDAAVSKAPAVKGKVAPPPKKALSPVMPQSYEAQIPVSNLTDSHMAPSRPSSPSRLPNA